MQKLQLRIQELGNIQIYEQRKKDGFLWLGGRCGKQKDWGCGGEKMGAFLDFGIFSNQEREEGFGMERRGNQEQQKMCHMKKKGMLEIFFKKSPLWH